MSPTGCSDAEEAQLLTEEQSSNKNATNPTVLGHSELRTVKQTWMGQASLRGLSTTSDEHPSNKNNFDLFF